MSVSLPVPPGLCGALHDRGNGEQKSVHLLLPRKPVVSPEAVLIDNRQNFN